jgi:hypothetical protein
MAWEFHEFDESNPREAITVIGTACEAGEHERCAGMTIDDGDIFLCVCDCHKVKDAKEE